MTDYGGGSALDLAEWTQMGKKVRGAGRRLLPRPAASKILE